jgi:hypothetical protein
MDRHCLIQERTVHEFAPADCFNSLLILPNAAHDVQIARADLADLEALAPLFDAYGSLPSAGRGTLPRLFCARLMRSNRWSPGASGQAIGFCQLYPTFSRQAPPHPQ